MPHVVVMVATSYPRFPGDGIGSFMEPIAKGVAARGHEVHLVAPWHPEIRRGKVEDGVHFHFFRYAPTRSLGVFGYAAGLRADTRLRGRAWAVAPAALAAGWFKAWRVATKKRATVMHGHWVVPGGVIAAAAAAKRPVVVSLHGSDVFVAERSRLAGRMARRVFERAAWVTACSEDLRTRALALGADPSRSEVLPYGVDTTLFAPDPDAGPALKREWRIEGATLIFTAGRLVSKKGFEYLIQAVPLLVEETPGVCVAIAGDGDLYAPLYRLQDQLCRRRVALLQNVPQQEVARLAAAADLIVIPSIRDDAGNVDGLPNFALEAMASGTPVIATRAGGLPQLIEHRVNGLLVPERDPGAIADGIRAMLIDPERARAMGRAAREWVSREHGWDRFAARLEAIYDAAAGAAPAPSPVLR